jgi:diaminopimelate epimerase
MRFTKMHGAGNDYVYVDCTREPLGNPREVARLVSDRHFGVGGDGLILIKKPVSAEADFYMDMYNMDGSSGRMCGNGIRCVAKYVYDRGMTGKTGLVIETLSGLKRVELHAVDGSVSAVTVNMGKPALAPGAIPVALRGEDIAASLRARAAADAADATNAVAAVAELEAVLSAAGISGDAVLNHEIAVLGSAYRVSCVSMGNPHAVIFTDEPVDEIELERIGPLFESHALFPERVNTEFVNVIDSRNMRMRVWERGSGETLACGTGTCAVLVAAALNGYTGLAARIATRGGALRNRWDAGSGDVYMTGPAAAVFEGEIDIDALLAGAASASEPG